MRKSIAFDLDGTLIDVSYRDYKIYKDVVMRLGGTPMSYAVYWPLRRAKTDIHKILEDSKITCQEQIQIFLHNRKALMENEYYLKNDSLFLDADKVLAELSYDFNIYILTIRHNNVNTENQFKRLGLNQYNCIIVESNKEEQMIRIPNLCYMVGDTENDIIPANKVGITSIAVTTGIRNITLLREMRPTYIVDNLDEVKDIVYGRREE